MPGIALAAGGPVGWAMVALNRHYATDTVGGAATAFAVVSAVALVLEGPLAVRVTGWTARRGGARDPGAAS